MTSPPPSDPYRRLLVLDRLEVGPVRLTPDRLEAPYRVVGADGSEDVLDFAYRWDEPVFEPDHPEDHNLAAVVAAQVALNYGLFCRRLILHGPLDRADRRFLADMAENTAREILVKKVLQPNPFLRPEVLPFPAERRERYLQAELDFPDAVEGSLPSTSWHPDADRWAVLSSGGKDSLLSYGLLSELDCEVHPVFINESGRHWFTALNAFRNFGQVEPRTTRVWTNSDRLFAWMLRHLPLVRQDFGRLRSDEYPIRLWTVAVFLFGALPVLRRRGAGRLVIGDEHDTTVRTTHQGIPHYDGLFDQSIYFDHALSRYFRRKGWGVSQLSLLRSLSELLIEKTLVRRYPELQRLQVSCHAAHTEGEVVRPCGKCEKCRRIVGMLVAFDADPAACGYPPDKVEAALKDLVEKGVHQEPAGARHLGYLLHRRGVIATPRLGDQPARRQAEVEKLRFHSERSPLQEVPRSIRRDLYTLLLEHAEGAVRRIGRRWVDFDPLSSPEMAAPYPFDPGPPRSRRTRDGRYLWGELTWPEAEEKLQQVDIALLPVGAVEQHGPHLPLDVDAFDADHLCRLVARGCSDPKPLVLPLLPYGVSYHHDDFPGTLSIGNETLSRLVYEVGMSAARNGVTKLVIVNGHGGNAPALHFAAQMINRDAHVFACVDTGESSDPEIYELTETPNDVHAGEIETSTTLAVRPELVQMERAEKFVPDFSSRYLDFTSRHFVGWYARTAKISPTGVLGDPTRASREKGEEMWELMVRHLVELVEHLKALSLEEIYQRRY